MPFAKGQSGNPAGRPRKNEEMRAALRRALKESDNKDAIARAIVREAAKGNVEAVKFVFDRIDGKVKDVLEAETTSHVVYEVHYADRDDPDHPAAAPPRPDQDRPGG